jgi:hypothetical protein
MPSARRVLASADRGLAQQVTHRIGISGPTRCGDGGNALPKRRLKLVRNKTRKPGTAHIAAEITAPGRGADMYRTTASGDPLDRPGSGQGNSALAKQRVSPAHKLQPNPPATSSARAIPSFKLADIVARARHELTHGFVGRQPIQIFEKASACQNSAFALVVAYKR